MKTSLEGFWKPSVNSFFVSNSTIPLGAVWALETEMDKNNEVNQQSWPITGIEVPELRGNTTLWAAFLMLFIISTR